MPLLLILISISLVFLHVLKLRGSYIFHFSSLVGIMTKFYFQLEYLIMRILDKVFVTGRLTWLLKSRIRRVIPDILAVLILKSGAMSGEVYTIEELESIVSHIFQKHKNVYIIVRTCPCRQAREIYCNNKSEPNITDIVFAFSEKPRPKDRFYKFITIKQAFEILKEADKAGFVHTIYGNCGKQVFGGLLPPAICNCKPGVCIPLQAWNKWRIPTIFPPHNVAKVDIEKCKGCKICVQRCPFGARIVKNGKCVVIKERCFGCGVCRITCQGKATKIIRNGHEPNFYPEYMLSKACITN